MRERNKEENHTRDGVGEVDKTSGRLDGDRNKSRPDDWLAGRKKQTNT